MSKIILCVTEGAKTEVNILKSLGCTFLPNEKIEFIKYKTSIYQLYQSMIKDEFLDTYAVLEEISTDKNDSILSNYSRDEIAEIYLFFDLDAHDNLAVKNPNCIEDMLHLFDNETENGKLYLSYPMVEAFKHPVANNKFFDIAEGKSYKTYVSTICDKKLENFSNNAFIRESWSISLVEHIKSTNFLLNDNQMYPTNYSDVVDIFTQYAIYQNQLRKYISQHNNVIVLSPFALFLIDYLGKPLFNEWKTICENKEVSFQNQIGS